VVKQTRTLEQVPSVPALLVPLMKCVSQPSGNIDIGSLVKLISLDSAIAAQCLRVTNSPLFATQKAIQTTHDAVTLLGVNRVREIATACCLFTAFSGIPRSATLSTFWKHSLACALVSRQIALLIGYGNPDEAYLAGLLHDIGIMVELSAFPGDQALVAAIAAQDRQPLHLAEQRELGFDHCAVGSLLAAHWNLAPSLQSVIDHHHAVENARSFQDLVCIVSLSDLFCRSKNMGYGYDEGIAIDLDNEPSWMVIRTLPLARQFDGQRFSAEVDAQLAEAETLLEGLSAIL
jgi:HD-like signal output (HDOD) protein